MLYILFLSQALKALNDVYGLVGNVLDLAAENSVEGEEALVITDPKSQATAFMEKTNVGGLGDGYQLVPSTFYIF